MGRGGLRLQECRTEPRRTGRRWLSCAQPGWQSTAADAKGGQGTCPVDSWLSNFTNLARGLGLIPVYHPGKSPINLLPTHPEWTPVFLTRAMNDRVKEETRHNLEGHMITLWPVRRVFLFLLHTSSVPAPGSFRNDFISCSLVLLDLISPLTTRVHSLSLSLSLSFSVCMCECVCVCVSFSLLVLQLIDLLSGPETLASSQS
jgi:hypothetical protein